MYICYDTISDCDRQTDRIPTSVSRVCIYDARLNIMNYECNHVHEFHKNNIQLVFFTKKYIPTVTEDTTKH